jgi:hypothetical protein
MTDINRVLESGLNTANRRGRAISETMFKIADEKKIKSKENK